MGDKCSKWETNGLNWKKVIFMVLMGNKCLKSLKCFNCGLNELGLFWIVWNFSKCAGIG